MEWRSCFPPPGLEPVVLIDRTPAGQRLPFYHLDYLQGMIAFTAYVDPEHGFVEGLEFRDNKGDVHAAGKPSTGAVKLSHHFANGETLVSIGCAEATKHSGIAIKVFESAYLDLSTLMRLVENQCLHTRHPLRGRIS